MGAKDPATHFASAVMLLGKYLLLLIIPYQLVCDYSFNQIPIVGVDDISFIVSFILFATIGIYAVLNFRKKNPIVFGLLFFLITLSLYSNIFFEVGSSFAERFMFLPSLGFSIFFVFLISNLLKVESKVKNQTEIEILKSKPVFTALFILILSLFSVKTITRAAEWKSQETLFSIDVKNSPNSAHMHFYRGLSIDDQAKKEKDSLKKITIRYQAVEQYEKGLSIYPEYANCFEKLGLAYNDLNDPDKSLYNFNNFIKHFPNKAEAWNFTGVIYFKQGNTDKAIENYKKAISLDSSYADAYFNMGLILGNVKRYDEAIYYFKKCIPIEPDEPRWYKFIGTAYQCLDKNDEARIWLDKANEVSLINKKPEKEKKREY